MPLPCVEPLALYRPRDPQASALWRLMDQHFPTFQHVYLCLCQLAVAEFSSVPVVMPCFAGRSVTFPLARTEKVHPIQERTGLRPGIFEGMAAVSKGTCDRYRFRGIVRLPEETESGSAGTQPDKGYSGSSAPMGVRPLTAFCRQGPFLASHWTLDLCLKKSTADARQHFRSLGRVALAA